MNEKPLQKINYLLVQQMGKGNKVQWQMVYEDTLVPCKKMEVITVKARKKR